MSFLAPLLPAAGLALGGLLGGGARQQAPQVNFTPPGFSAGGLTATFGNNGYSVSPSADRMNLVGGLSNTFGQQAGDIASLRSSVTPGFSALRSAQLSTLNANRTSALGNLRDNLARRRILGSSFASDALARADQEYQQTAANVVANTFLSELDASSKLIQQQYEAARGQFTTGINEMNLEADLAAKLTGNATSALNSAAQTQAQLDAKAAAGTGSFFGGLGQMIGQGAGQILSGSGSSLGSLFGSSAGTAAAGSTADVSALTSLFALA